MTNDAESSVDRYFRAVSDLDREAYLDSFSPDAVVRDPYDGPRREGTPGLNAFFDGMEKTWESFEMTPAGAYRSGNRVAVPWTASGKAKSGKQADFAGVNVFSLDDDGRIQQLDGYWDYEEMVAQLREREQ